MLDTLFGHPIDLGTNWEDASVRTFIWKEDGGVSSSPFGGSGGFGPIGLAMSNAGTFRSNLIVLRERQGASDVRTHAAKQRGHLTERFPSAKFLREGPTELCGLPAHEQEFSVVLDHPLPRLKQWHVTVAREGYLYHICGSAVESRFAQDVARFRALLATWR